MTDIRRYGVPKGEDRYPEEILYTLALLYNVINSDISAFLKTYGLSVGKLNILVAIRGHGGTEGIRQVEISQYLIVTPSNMTKMIDKMEQEGLVARFPLAGDRRVNMIRVTPEGFELLEAVWAGYMEKLKGAVKGLTVPRQKQLAAMLTEWFESL